MEFGKKIRQLRFKAGLTQGQLAEKMGVGAQAVSKWENATAMPDIASLPLLAEVFGVSIDDLFDLTAEQRLGRIENRLDREKELPQDVFREFEEYLLSLLDDEAHRNQAVELTAYLYWHRMNACAKKTSRYAREAVRLSPGKKGCQWMLMQAENHAAWDWNVSNHTEAAEFYRELSEANPGERLPCLYLLDNLIADRRADEAERVLEKLRGMEGANPVMNEVYRARIALARFDEAAADGIIEGLLGKYGEDTACLFEAAQYYAEKCDYGNALRLYELSFEKDKERPRFQDALQGIALIYRIMGDYGKAAETYDRIVDLLRDEWGITEGAILEEASEERERLAAKAK